MINKVPQKNYPVLLVNFPELLKLSASALFLGNFSEIVALQRCAVSLREEVDHPVVGDSVEKRRHRVFVHRSSSFRSLDQVPSPPSRLDGAKIVSWLIHGGVFRRTGIYLHAACFYWVKGPACTREIYLEQRQSAASYLLSGNHLRNRSYGAATIVRREICFQFCQENDA